MKKSWPFHVIILAAIIGTFMLGVWQLQRREWKHELIRHYEQQSRQPALPLTVIPRNTSEWLWRNIYVTGRLDNSKYIFIPGYLKVCGPGHWGQWVYGIATLPSGEKVILEIGWQVSQKPDPTKQEDFEFPDKMFSAQITPVHSGKFVKNNPKKNQWITVDQEMYAAFNTPPQPFYLRLNAETMHTCDQIEDEYSIIRLPVELYGGPNLSDNHLQYAITWFALAAVLLALYLYKIHDDRRKLP